MLPSCACREADDASVTRSSRRFTSVATNPGQADSVILEKSAGSGYESIMNDTQLYFAIGVPVFAVMMSFLGNMLQINSLNARFTSIEGRLTGMEANFNSRFGILEARFDTLIGKVIEIDNRLTRVEERLDRR